jgi:hypothetical protein
MKHLQKRPNAPMPNGAPGLATNSQGIFGCR